MQSVKRWSVLAVASVLSALAVARPVAGQAAPPPSRWKSTEITRPRPPEIAPPAQALPVAAPSDAIVLFDGRDLSRWELVRGGPADWKVENGYMEVVNGPGVIDPKWPGTELDRVLGLAAQESFRVVAILPAILLIVFAGIWLYDRSQGGFKKQTIKQDSPEFSL